jgi:hypothetical protein
MISMWFGSHWQTIAITMGAFALVVAAGTVVVLTATSAPPARVSLDLTIHYDPSTWYVTFSPSTFEAPAHTVIQFTITNYDPTSHDVAVSFCNVSGTVGLTMGEQMQGSGATMTVGRLSPSDVSETFTMISDGYDLNIPIPPAASAHSPSVIIFSFETLGSGVTTWASEATNGGPHGASGTMTGFFDSA